MSEITLNPLKAAASDIDWVINFLVHVSAGYVSDDVKSAARAELVRLVADKTELSMRVTIEAFECIPLLQDFANRLRTVALPGEFGKYFAGTPNI